MAQTGPRQLPPPNVPLDRLPAPSSRNATEGVPSRAPGVPNSAPYLGPPAGIDGPLNLTPPDNAGPEVIAPGLGPDGQPLLPGGMEEEMLLDESFLTLQPQKLAPYKNGFFQQLSLSAAWFGNSHDPNDLGGTEIETYLRVALPAPIKEWPLVITPGFNMTLIDGPTVTDLPSRLYLAYVDFMWLPVIVNRWTALLSVAPSEFGDFHAEQFRLTGKGLAIYDWTPGKLQLVAGVLYLNRENIRLLPAGGAIWTPTDWTRFELIFPKPKLGVRVGVGPGYEDWVYTTAEFGGNTWPIIRTGGQQDNVTYIDYRLISGFERKISGGAGYRLEAGYVFGRSIRFTSGNGDFDPQNTIILRGGITF